MKKLVMSLVTAFAASCSLAATETVGGYKWTYRVYVDKAVISGVSPSKGALTIPSTLGGKPVKTIGENAFENSSGLTSVTIPDSVARIEGEAFAGCIALASVTIGNGVTCIGEEAFADCSGLTNVAIPNSVTSIGRGAFRGCSGLTSVMIPNSVASIGAGTFEGTPFYDNQPDGLIVFGKVAYAVKGSCPAAVTIPDGVTSIGGRGVGHGAFSGCSGLTSVTIPNSVTSIGDWAFYGCTGLTSVTIPDSVTSIGIGTFFGCSGLTSVTIPDSVTSIGNHAFYDCSETLFDTTTIPGVTLMDGWVVGVAGWLSGRLNLSGVRGIVESAFDGSSETLFDTATIPGVKLVDGWVIGNTGSLSGSLNLTGVRDIADNAFSGCSGLTSVTIPDSVTSIGSSAFKDCVGLTSVTIPNGVIGEQAFADCDGLASVTIGNGVTCIGEEAFSGCWSLKSVTFLGNAPTVGPGAFSAVTAGCTAYVRRDSTGWGVNIPGTWNGIKIAYADTNGGSSGGAVAEIWKKAQTVDGAMFMNGDAVGIIQVKVGKANKNGEVAVSGTITGLDGKKLSAKGGKVAVDGETATVTLAVKGGTTATVTIGNGGISGSWNDAEIRMSVVGGNWTRTDAKVYVDAAVDSLPSGTLVELLPVGEPVVEKGGKWTFAKAASVKWAKPKKGAALPEIYDEASGKGLIIDDSKGKTNLSGLKLAYTPKKGTFKGSFKVYALEGASPKQKLKKYTVNVSGIVINSCGSGMATCKKPALAWPVTVR